MHQAQWGPERPLPPPVSLASQKQKLFLKCVHFTQKHITLDDEILFTENPTQCEIPEGHMLGLILNK